MSAPSEHFFVNGIVAARDKQPYIQIATEHGMVAQLTMAQAQQIARDILVMAARTEMDAMVLKFFSGAGFPEGAAASMMTELREYRAKLDEEAVERI